MVLPTYIERKKKKNLAITYVRCKQLDDQKQEIGFFLYFFSGLFAQPFDGSPMFPLNIHLNNNFSLLFWRIPSYYNKEISLTVKMWLYWYKTV